MSALFVCVYPIKKRGDMIKYNINLQITPFKNRVYSKKYI